MKVSVEVKEQVDALVTALQAAFGDELVCVLAHGSAVRGGWTEGSDVDLVIVLREASREGLERSANALVGARWAARIESLILLEREIARSADVFPVFYGEIMLQHEVLHGVDPFAGLELHRDHLRLRVEQELREAQIRMRRAVVDAQGRPDHLRGLLTRKVKQVRSPLRVLLELTGRRVSPDLRAVLEAAGALLGVEVAPLVAQDGDVFAAHARLVELLERAIHQADTLELAS